MSGFDERSKIYKKIEEERGSKLLTYVTGDRPGLEAQIGPDVVDIFVEHLDALWPTEKLSLYLYTTGGDTAAAWRLINLLRTFCDELEVLVVNKAHSAGTLMCLGANRIVMTKQATLSPIDPSLNNILNPTIPGAPNKRAPVSVEAVQGYLDLARETLDIKDQDSLTKILTHLADKIHPLVLGQIFRTRTQIRALARKLLENQELDDEKTEAIIAFLCSESGSHDHTINRREAHELGLVIEKPDQRFYEVLRELDHSIAKTLELRTPYSLPTLLAGAPRASYTLRRGLIESRPLGSHQFISEGVVERVQIPGPNNVPQDGFRDDRQFEAWRREADAEAGDEDVADAPGNGAPSPERRKLSGA